MTGDVLDGFDVGCTILDAADSPEFGDTTSQSIDYGVDDRYSSSTDLVSKVRRISADSRHILLMFLACG